MNRQTVETEEKGKGGGWVLCTCLCWESLRQKIDVLSVVSLCVFVRPGDVGHTLKCAFYLQSEGVAQETGGRRKRSFPGKRSEVLSEEMSHVGVSLTETICSPGALRWGRPQEMCHFTFTLRVH